jgi:tetratricopeptide (TPR) repeat protein
MARMFGGRNGMRQVVLSADADLSHPWDAMRLLVGLALLAVACGSAPPKVKTAKQFYVDGKMQFEVEQYQAALEDWENAYLLHPDPAFLFDIGQANKKLGNLDRALENFRDYLNALPLSPNRPTVEKMITETEKEIKKKKR